MALASLMLLVTGSLTAWGYSRTAHRYYTEWNYFELGAHAIVGHHTNPLYAGGGLHLYVTNPQLQIGPLAFLVIAPFEWLRWSTLAALFVAVMALIGMAAVTAAMSTGQALRGSRLASTPVPIAIAAALVAGIWGYNCATWRHLDDAIALLLSVAAMRLILARKPWWLVGLMLGTAAATKPWAIILVPVILGLPRRDRARTLLVVLATTAAWWAPFIVAAPQTTVALGRYIVLVEPGSVLHLLGFRGTVQSWLRPTQFMLGIGIGGLVALRRSWIAAPLAAIAVRVMTDPYIYAYYGLGPLLLAFLYDCSGESGTGFPVFTAATALVEFVLPPMRPGSTATGLLKLIWALGILGFILFRRRRSGSRELRYDDLRVAPLQSRSLVSA